MSSEIPLHGRDTDMSEPKLLQSIVEVARHVFAAAASSIFVVEETSGDLIFEAVAGEGEEHLLGSRFPAGTGIVGWVAISGQPMMVDDVSKNPAFAKDAASSTGFLPSSIMAAPLIRHGRCIGVLEVLDSGVGGRGQLADIELLSLLATQAALGLELLLRVRGGRDTAATQARTVIERIAAHADGPVDDAALRALALAEELLAQRR
ncbi:GAF domain-containing protein [Nonomuraea purpurea]|uniref:GAF domain-containing protein n=1 Tax=Nonomuraea purpurea TaxID=1849276 RepID=A0ABV8G8F2_9ACTN